MSNMSYCRFENTLGDLQDCVYALEAIDEGEAPPLSRTEARAAEQLLVLATDLAVRLSEYSRKDIEDLEEKDAAEFIAYIQEIAESSARGEI